MPKVENTSKDTDKQLSTIQEIQNPKQTSMMEPDKKDEEILGFIKKRRTAMQAKRNVMDRKWATYMKQYEAIFTPYTDWRSSSNVPLERAIIELFVAEAIKRPTNFKVNPLKWFEYQAQVFDQVWKRYWSTYNIANTILENEYITGIFWTSALYVWFEQSYRIVKDFDGVDENWKMKFKRKMIHKSDITTQNVDIRYLWIDDRAKKIEEAVDCIYEEYLSYEEFMNYKLDNEYDEKKLEGITATKQRGDNRYIFLSQEERGDGQSKYVKITKYWNVQLDMYYEIANDKVIIKAIPILNANHCLPFVIRQYGKNLFGIYGYGLCEWLMTFKSDINKLREMLMDAIKRSNQEVIAIGWGLTFDGNQFAFNNQFLKFKGNIDQNFRQLTGNPPNQAIFSYLERLYKDIAVFCWLDIQNILWEAQQTAYQTAVQKESSLQRVNVVLRNRDVAFERLANLLKDNFQMFLPLKLVRGIVEVNDDGDYVEEPEREYLKIETPLMKNKKFQKRGKQMFEITPEAIRWDIKIDVSTDFNAPAIAEVEKAQKMEFFQKSAEIAQMYQANPELEKLIPLKKAIQDMAELNNIEIDYNDDDQEVQDAKKWLYEQILSMKNSVWKWSIQNQWQPTQPEENLAEVSQEWQPAKVPSAPTIS